MENAFNSTMVRLKVFEGKQRRRLQLFQFHYGTIKRFGYRPFNSTMVRLFQNIKSFIFHFIIFSEEVYYIRIEILKISILKLFLFVFSQ